MHDGGRDDRIPSVYLQMSGVTKPNAGDALDDSTLCFTRSSCDWSRGNGSGTQYQNQHQLSLLLRTGIFPCIPILRIRLASNDVFPTN